VTNIAGDLDWPHLLFDKSVLCFQKASDVLWCSCWAVWTVSKI